jgi:hypothetical protein
MAALLREVRHYLRRYNRQAQKHSPGQAA